MESNLAKIFALATSWQAILLMWAAFTTLADRIVFINNSLVTRPTFSLRVVVEEWGQQQTETPWYQVRLIGLNYRHNFITHGCDLVFLRVLEYYHGIMFLTTNQIAQFDVAIPSRIHISVQYNRLRPEQMERIFKGFLQPLEDKNLVDEYDEILQWLKEDVYNIGLDGRQIRNVVTAALGLARADLKDTKGKGKLTKQHLKSVVLNTRRFKDEFLVQYDRYITAQEKLIK